MKVVSSILLLCFAIILGAQEITWTNRVADLIFDNCSSCHHEGAIAPFNLMVYEDVVSYADFIHHSIEERSMPPWPADPNYRHFVDEAYLEEQEIDDIHQWIENDMPFGDPTIEPEQPVFLSNGSILESIDYTIEMEPYTLQYNHDEYRWFVIENPFDVPIYIEKIEVIPGLEQIVHHADLFLDDSGVSLNFDLQDTLSGFNSDTGAPSNSKYINAWQPGGNVIDYPENWAIVIPPNADFVFEIHYGPDGQGMTDMTKMNLQFVKDPSNIREVKASWLMLDSPPTLIDGPLIIPANEVVSFHQITAPIPKDLSLIAICPHMHFLGKSYRVWYETIEGDSIPLIDIPRWDFHWQKYYAFQEILKLPEGAVLKSEGFYDNTEDNHDNPNIPPVTVSRGLTTNDEMFLCFFIYADYQEGDEQIIMDSSLLVSTQENEFAFANAKIDLYPNPATDELNILSSTKEFDQIQLLDAQGNLIKIFQRPHALNTIETSNLPEGLYFLQFDNNSNVVVKKFVKL